MENALAAVCVLLCVLHGAKSAEINHAVDDWTAGKQPSLGIGRKLGAVAADVLGAFVPSNQTANRGTCTMEIRLESGFARKGEAFRQTTTPNALDCAHMCNNAVAGCIAMNYRHSDRVCFFLANPGYIFVSLGYTTALVNTSLNNVCNMDNLILGYGRWKGDMPGSPYHVESATKCCEL